MDGIRGLANWRWIFILEGIVTTLIGIISFFFLADFPSEAIWLTEKEKDFIFAKTKAGETHTIPLTPKDVLIFFKDARNILGAVMYFCELDPYSVAAVCMLTALSSYCRPYLR